ncbi:MAG: efflux RND transporter periplasmic adaptor subunit [Bacteroidota bacterium]|nr:efflux RND transporter periplasmic adaptor subunit [Bacteroidota bacterium]MDP4214856.1 efflux RND transporter periplasmic adaptor subunit [Bacteroidota bacterium]MDP4246732.1 efflux RND transporter periplasmic adaptor subunit [Bacteroidota bacterium]MDP4254915.1 efflux RND transporter periplasmic adaptor subunit [Bacteroidota bacterium]MDP4257979.1 efflux RND transporter periplasmic adaptor subunit [Bacteroidota bacterium]
MNKKLLWIIVGIVALILILVLAKKSGIMGQDEGLKVSMEKVIKRDITEIVTASGKVYPEKEVKISPDISGEVVELKVTEEGDSVKKGQELVKINPDIYSAQRDQAAAQVNQQEALVSNVKAQLPGLKGTMDAAQKTYDRQKQLLDQKVISVSEFEAAESALKTAQANYAAAEQTVKGNMASVANARANLDMAAKNLIRTTVVSPIDGVVSLLEIKKGERVVGNSMMAGTEMMRVADMSKIEAVVDVGENDIPKVRLGDSALIEVDAYNNRKFKGTVTEIASNAATATASATSTNDVTNYKVHIRLIPASYKDLINPSRPKSFPFRPGMSASADIQTNTHVAVLSVPINAVTTREKNSDNTIQDKSADPNAPPDNGNGKTSPSAIDPDEVVFVLQPDNTVKKVKVRTDIQDINYIEIVDGVKEGDQIIAGPYSIVSKTLRTGTKVKVVPKDKLFEPKKD